MVDCLLYSRPLSFHQTLSSSDGRLFTVHTTTVSIRNYRPLMVDCLLCTRPLSLYETLSSFDGQLLAVQSITVSLSDTIVLRWSTACCTVDHCLSIRHYRPLMVNCLLYGRPLSLYQILSSSDGRLLTVHTTTVSLSDTIVL